MLGHQLGAKRSKKGRSRRGEWGILHPRMRVWLRRRSPVLVWFGGAPLVVEGGGLLEVAGGAARDRTCCRG